MILLKSWYSCSFSNTCFARAIWVGGKFWLGFAGVVGVVELLGGVGSGAGGGGVYSLSLRLGGRAMPKSSIGTLRLSLNQNAHRNLDSKTHFSLLEGADNLARCRAFGIRSKDNFLPFLLLCGGLCGILV